MADKSVLAPISITVYDRLEHLTNCLDSIRKSKLAKETELYIYSDAPKPGHEERIDRVREFCTEIGGFRKVHLTFQKSNDYRKNGADARSLPLLEHGKIIRLEDDNVVAPGFLSYMNGALEFYENEQSVLSISGYSPPIQQERFTSKDVYLSKFYSAWGHATWAHKSFLAFCREEHPYKDMIANELSGIVKSIHPSLEKALKKIDDGMHYAPDQVLTYLMIKHGMYQVKPTFSLVQNTGHDGSGIHCQISSHFNHSVSYKQINFKPKNLNYIPEIDQQQYRFFYPRIETKVWRRLKRAFESIRSRELI